MQGHMKKQQLIHSRKKHLINNPYDLLKVGFIKSEVEAIIKGNSNNH